MMVEAMQKNSGSFGMGRLQALFLLFNFLQWVALIIDKLVGLV